jgi:hypothetical protein
MDLIIIAEEPENEIRRSVTLTNEQWAILAMCTDAYADAYRVKHSQTVATYVTRGQMIEAQAEATRMNELLQQLDKLQALLL